MAWTLLACQFALELGFGVLLALAFVPRAPVGVLFYRLMGTTAALPIGAALWLHLRGGGAWTELGAVGALVALAGFPLYSGAVRGMSWWVGLALGLAGSALAVAAVIAQGLPDLGLLGQGVATLSALATGTVAGSVGLAMVLGHWYLTVPKLEIHYLQRLNRVTVAAMLASAGLFALSLFVFSGTLRTSQPSLFDPFGLFYLGTRVAVGLALPLVFAAMAASSLRFKNTRSATGILYASTVLVLIGTAVSVFLQDSYRVPL